MFTINYRDNRPIYEQVHDSLRRAIITGVMIADEKIPSVRELAVELAINPNTIQRAYRELEIEGYIYSVPGKGSFVSEISSAKTNRRDELFAELNTTVSELVQVGVSADEICAHVKNSIKEDGKS